MSAIYSSEASIGGSAKIGGIFSCRRHHVSTSGTPDLAGRSVHKCIDKKKFRQFLAEPPIDALKNKLRS